MQELRDNPGASSSNVTPRRTLRVETRSIDALKPNPLNARTHSKKQVKQIAASIKRFGWTAPILIAEDVILAGNGRLQAAKLLRMEQVSVLDLSDLTSEERRAYMLADNKLALNAGWDSEILAGELQTLVDLQFDMEPVGFSVAEIDLALDKASESDPKAKQGPEDDVPPAAETPVTRRGDIWHLGRHRILCGDARLPSDFAALMGDEQADMIFTDPPYNVPIDGHVCGSGSVKHREFALASGEMSSEQFTEFLTHALVNTASAMRDGAIAFVCMDWRHIGEMHTAGQRAFTEFKNLVVWNKTNGGMGTFYRSKHELIFVFKHGTAKHTNSFGLGDTGRYRTNVWDHPGISSIGSARSEELAMHPTVKPIALIADAMRDCSRRGEIILDCFGGSGSTLIAAEKTGRKARLIELDPVYCDVIVKRWEAFTGKHATLAATGQSFEDVADARLGDSPAGEEMVA